MNKHVPTFAIVVLTLTLAAAAPLAQHTRLFKPEDLSELEGPDRDEWQRHDKIMDVLGIGEASVVADLGAGSGWFTLKLAGRVGPNGMVYADDVQRQMIQAIKIRVDRLGLKNVTTVLGTSTDPRLPAPIDAVLIVDAYHEMEQPVMLLRNLATSLRPEGRIGIVDFTKDGGGPGPAMEERVDPEAVIRDAQQAGLVLRSRETFLKYQYMLVVRKAALMIAAPPFFAVYQSLVNAELDRLVADDGSAVSKSMVYTVGAPSKRVRPVLSLLAAELCGGNADRAVPAAAVMELVHAASLILDDLPSMDDAPLRRGRKANHLEFGEAVAILAAFGLLNLAYGTLARAYEPAISARLASILSDAIGLDGLIGGQAIDLLATDQQVSFETLERIHRGKTGALFSASATAGAIVSGASLDVVRSLAAYAKNLGLAFQIIDDLLDVEGDPIETGKAARADAKKTTFVSFSGIQGARQLALELCQTADQALEPFGRRADRLRELSAFVAARSC